ncbi:septum formation family protein [Streptomyces sp. WMMC897]|uniref:septum formation family protein n=1 Tax=Streptomyces sp. WMMC897 TaxID=3014782 RepID=UPI0022B70645|nr:septum formation family protein [Streptomyces sp. WMMC897]MCZ7415648.1 septum formation family protein [Streptomyces sp. WMMC897]
MTVVVAVVVVGALVAGGVLLLTGDDGENEARPGPSFSESVTTGPSESDDPRPDPSEGPTETPYETPSDDPYETPSGDPDASPSGLDWESIMPSPTDNMYMPFQLDPGDCFDQADKKGFNEKASCAAPHDGEVIHQAKLPEEGMDTDEEIETEAQDLCDAKWREVGRRQPSTAGLKTYAQFPSRSGFSLGMRTVTCSLLAGDGDKLDGPLK